MAARNRAAFALVAALLVARPGFAQEAKAPAPPPPSSYTLAIAAGYKAAMLCGAILNAQAMGAERSRDSVEANELVGTYPEYDKLIAPLKATIGTGRVLVDYDPAMPPRVALSDLWRGCTVMPIGTAANVAGRDLWIKPGLRRPTSWPASDPKSEVEFGGSLAPIADRAFTDGYGLRTNTTAIVITRSTRLLGERYKAGFGPNVPQRTWSVAKSITGTLVGIAAKEGLLSVDKPAPIANWQQPDDPRRAIKLDNLLRMASGLHSDTAGNRTDAVYFGGTAVDENVPGWPLEAMPGTRFRYANNDILLAMLSLRSVLGDDRYQTFPDQALFGRIGMAHTIAETDWRGNFISSSQVWTTARDLARFGLLYLNDGIWNGERLLPSGWANYVASPAGPQPDRDMGYGASFWLLNKSPGVPADSYAAIGNRGQYVVIVPARSIVIVRRGEDPTGANFDIAKFTADILAAIK